MMPSNQAQQQCSRFRVSPVGLAVALAVLPALTLTGTAFAQGSAAVEITGSRIKRIDAETASPVQTITRQDIERVGVQNINDLLQQITGASYAADDRITNGFAPGGGALNLRGLGFNSTLVLIDGRRVPSYPFAQQFGTSQGFNDLNSIPLAAVERIDVLKDGASAIYGADAVAGVVNIITRRDFQGAEIGVGMGRSSRSDGDTRNANLVYGRGNLEKDRYNLLITATVSTRDEIKSSARPWSNTEDLRPLGGSDRRSAYGTPGTIIDYETGAFFYNAGGQCGPATQFGGSSIRTFCRYDRPQFGSLYPASDKIGTLAKLNVAITPSITGFAEILFTRNKFRSVGWPAGTTDDVGLGSYFIPAGNPSSPFKGDAEVYYRFSDVGNRGEAGTSDTTRLVAGARGVTAGWDWEAALNLNRISNDTVGFNQTLNSRLMCLLNPQAAASYAKGGAGPDGATLAQIFAANPSYADYFRTELGKCGEAFAKFGYYNFVNPGLNKPGTADYLRHNALRQGLSNLYGVDVRASRDLMRLSGGMMGIAVGFESRSEKVSDVPDRQLQTGDTLSISAAQAFGDRRVDSAYTEINAPVTKQLEVSGALRHDRYSGNGSFASTSPKVGVKWQPSKQWLLRGTASGAFRAPSLFETSPAQQTAFTFGITDPKLCPAGSNPETNPNCSLDVRRVQQGNPNLKAEKSNAFTFGTVLEPVQNLSFAVDFWKIDRKDEIGAFGDQLLVNLFTNDPNIVVRDSQGRIQQVNSVPVQLNKTSTWGWDWEVRMAADLGAIGKGGAKLGMTNVRSFKFSTLDDEGKPSLSEYNGTYNQPRYRTQWMFNLNRGPVEYSLGGYGMAAYDGLGKTTKVSGVTVWNAGVSYTGFKNLTIRAQVNNLLDRAPSFNDESSAANAGYNPSLSDPIGRFYAIRANYRF